MISTHEYAATLVVAGVRHELAVMGGRVNMDEGQAPHAVATLTIPTPPETVQELFDPRETCRVEITATATYHPRTPAPQQSATFDLGLRDRRIVHRDGEVVLSLASDEALLMDDVLLATTANTDALAYQHSLRAIIDNVILSRIGAALEDGTADAPFRVLFNVRNLLENPGGDVDTSGIVEAGNATFTRETGTKRSGAGSIRVANTAPGLYAIMLDTTVDTTAGAHTVSPGDERNLSVWARANAVHDLRLGLRWLDDTGTQIGSDVVSADVPMSTSAWQRVSVSGTAPAGAARLKPIVWGEATTGGTVLYLDDMVLANTLELVDAFNGDTEDTIEYGYTWDDAPGISRSTRTALMDRSPDLLNWEPGRSAWDFVQPLFRAAGLRLFCDEQRRWYLVEPSYVAAGHTQLAAGTSVLDATDTIARDTLDWYDAALVTYRWNDADNVPQVRYDWYAAPGHTMVKTLEVEQAYPGPGAAEYMVLRAAGKGRQITATVVSKYTARPSQPVTITLDATPVQSGVIASVEWNLDDDEMTVQSRGLSDTPANAVDLLDGTIDELVGTIDGL